jgi:hypothetical protein
MSDEDTYPLYAVNSETLEYSQIPEECQEYVSNSDLKVPQELFMLYLSSISKYGLNTVVVPNLELHKYRQRIAKKKGLEIEIPKAEKPEKLKKTKKVKEADEA